MMDEGRAARAAQELLEWYFEWKQKVSPAMLSGMLMSAAADLLSDELSATRELFLEVAERGWNTARQKKARRGQVPS